MKNKRGSTTLWISIAVVAVLIIILFFYFVLFKPSRTTAMNIENPALGLSLEQSLENFNESYIYYLLYVIKAYNLHNPPLSSDTPKIEVIADNEAYNAEVIKGNIIVKKSGVENRDAVIRTTKEEIVKIMNNENYASESFSSGKSSLELVASKTTLFAKGYLNLYKKITGKSMTGSVIRIYFD